MKSFLVKSLLNYKQYQPKLNCIEQPNKHRPGYKTAGLVIGYSQCTRESLVWAEDTPLSQINLPD